MHYRIAYFTEKSKKAQNCFQQRIYQAQVCDKKVPDLPYRYHCRTIKLRYLHDVRFRQAVQLHKSRRLRIVPGMEELLCEVVDVGTSRCAEKPGARLRESRVRRAGLCLRYRDSRCALPGEGPG